MIPDDDQWPDEAKFMERRYRNTWLCTNCGSRHSFTVNVCPKWTEPVRNKANED